MHENIFGTPDGARSGLTEVNKDFIQIQTSSFPKINDQLISKIRVVIGSKGSGKTLFLRKLNSLISNNHSVLVSNITSGDLRTESVVKFSKYFNESQLIEMWTKLWHICVLYSLSTYLLAKSNRKISNEYHSDVQRILDDLLKIKKYHLTHLSIYGCATDLIETHGTSIIKLIKDVRWIELENSLSLALKSHPPLYFFNDCIDEEYSHEPKLWLNCQVGLFYQLMRMLRDPQFGSKFHNIVAFRNDVIGNVFGTEHQSRYRSDPNICVLNWNYDAIKFFLVKKIQKLAHSDLLNPGELAESPFKAWLGIESIFNKTRQVVEPIDHYLIRHTRQSPRDIIILGNRLASLVSEAKTKGDKKVNSDKIISCVADVSRAFGNEQLSVASNHIVSNSSMYSVDDKSLNPIFSNETKKLIKSSMEEIGQDKIEWHELQEHSVKIQEIFSEDVNFFTILWRTGLIGIRKKKERKVKYFSGYLIDELELPSNQDLYIFHPCLTDTCGLVPTDQEPPIISDSDFKLQIAESNKNIKIIEFMSWEEYKSKITSQLFSDGIFRNNKFLFRGQKSDHWKLQPSFDRKYSHLKIKERRDIEKELIELFYENSNLRELHGINEEGAIPFAQHYNIPTRLLDWSLSPYIAAFFSFSEILSKPEKESQYVAIWVLDSSADIWNEENGVKIISAAKSGNLRLRNQMGKFTLMNTPFNCLEEYVASFELKEVPLFKVLLPTSEARKAVCDLDIMGINHEQLFPDIVGYAKSAQTKIDLKYGLY